jgi:cold-inducible RNA-binding protein
MQWRAARVIHGKEKETMTKKIYVGNLAYTVTEDDLNDAFGKIGEVQSVKIIKDVATGRSKGFGFVEMSTEQDADKAISTLNGTMFMDRALNVSEARPQTGGGKVGGRPRQEKSFGRGKGSDRWR